MKNKISLITLGVADLKKSLAFYRDGLGLPTHDYKEEQGIVFFEMEGTWLSLYPRDKLADDIGQTEKLTGHQDEQDSKNLLSPQGERTKVRGGKNLPLVNGAGGISGGVTLAHNVKTKEEVDATVQSAVDAGAKLIKQPQEVFWGGYSGYFSDPDGHLWEVAWNPFMDLT